MGSIRRRRNVARQAGFRRSISRLQPGAVLGSHYVRDQVHRLDAGPAMDFSWRRRKHRSGNAELSPSTADCFHRPPRSRRASRHGCRCARARSCRRCPSTDTLMHKGCAFAREPLLVRKLIQFIVASPGPPPSCRMSIAKSALISASPRVVASTMRRGSPSDQYASSAASIRFLRRGERARCAGRVESVEAGPR